MPRYPYDPQVRELLTRLLYARLPAWYRAEDSPPRGEGDLRAFLEVLAAPLAAVRQNVEELHGDLFIDSASDRALRLLAGMVGTDLLFTDPDANRRDVRGTVGWRRRKGTPRTLESLAEDVTEQLVVTQEGFQRVQLAQEIRRPFLLRPGRIVPDVRDPTLRDTSDGPLDARHHALDLRAISHRTGRCHPRHVVHWIHPTRMFPVLGGTAANLSKESFPDRRFAVDPMARWLPLRAARSGSDDRLPTDRIPPTQFARDPGDWFGVEGRFAVRVAGLLAAVARPASVRRPSRLVASPQLLDGPATRIHLLEQEPRRRRGGFTLTLVSLPAPSPGDPIDFAAPAELASLTIDTSGHVVKEPGLPASGVGRIAALALRPHPMGTTCRVPRLALEIRNLAPAAERASPHIGLAREGFLAGALHVEVPETSLSATLYLLVAADGSLYRVQSGGAGSEPDVLLEVVGGALALPPEALHATGPGAAWPPLPPTGDPTPLRPVLCAPGAGSAVLHGGRVQSSAGLILSSTPCALEFAARAYVEGEWKDHPFARLRWTGADPTLAASWTPVDEEGTTTEGADARWRAIAVIESPIEPVLVVRFASDTAGAVLPPCEMVWWGLDGGATLVHLPELQAASPVGTGWPSPHPFASEPVQVGADGATVRPGTSSITRWALGQVAPLAEPVALRRRRIGHRVLCPWRNETSSLVHQPTPAGWLHVDVAHGLFAFSDEDALPELPVASTEPAPPTVSVDFQEGFTAHIGARPAPRMPTLGEILPRPTRIVSASGALERGVPPDWHKIPRYRTLGAALMDIEAEPGPEEIIRFQDSATYPMELPAWPTGVSHLRLHAAEGTRPVVRFLEGGSPAVELGLLEIIGLHIEGGGTLELPACRRLRLAFVTVERSTTLALATDAEGSRFELLRCVLGSMTVAGQARILVEDTLLDGGGEETPALQAPEATLQIERATVRGRVSVGVLEASGCLFWGRVEAADRFRGCVRFSRVAPGAEQALPRLHRVVHDQPLFVELDPASPARFRLHQQAPHALTRGGEDGSEVGVFASRKLPERLEGLERRLAGHTPAGLVTGNIRSD